MIENNNEFEKRVEGYIGKIVTVKYYDKNRGGTIIERLAVSEITPTHIMMITTYGGTLGLIGLAKSKIESIYSEQQNELIENPNYTNENTMKL